MDKGRCSILIDAHVHLEKGEYCLEWVNEFIQNAVARNIDEIHFVEHTHLFKECTPLYNEMSAYNAYQNQWFNRKLEQMVPIEKYMEFIEKMRKEHFNVKVQFGLEVCYSPEHEKEIQRIKDSYSFNFLVGSIHFIDGWAFSHLKQPWSKEEYNLDDLYSRYYQLMMQLADCGLFSGLAHPNSLQCFGAYPEKEYHTEYQQIAEKLKRNNMYIEESSGLAISYGDKKLGMNQNMLKTMLKNNVQILTASDAHVPENVGRRIQEMNDLIEKEREILDK